MACRGRFLPQIVHTNSPTAPIWNIFNGVGFLLEKNIIATKVKENGWVVGVLWGFEPFSHDIYHIRVYMHHVCLIQSFSTCKATHIQLGTCSGSSQCQLHFGTKVVSIGWSGCEWLPSECKNAQFQAFPPLPLSAKILYIHHIYGSVWFWPTLCMGNERAWLLYMHISCMLMK